MSWSLIASLLPFVALLGILVVHQLRSEKKFKQHRREHQEHIRPIAKIADDAHKKKFGRPSTELNEVFPDLHAVK